MTNIQQASVYVAVGTKLIEDIEEDIRKATFNLIVGDIANRLSKMLAKPPGGEPSKTSPDKEGETECYEPDVEDLKSDTHTTFRFGINVDICKLDDPIYRAGAISLLQDAAREFLNERHGD